MDDCFSHGTMHEVEVGGSIPAPGTKIKERLMLIEYRDAIVIISLLVLWILFVRETNREE